MELHFGGDAVSAKHPVTLFLQHATNGKTQCLKKLYTDAEAIFGLVGSDHELSDLRDDFIPLVESAFLHKIYSPSRKSVVVWKARHVHWAFDRGGLNGAVGMYPTASESCLIHSVCVWGVCVQV
jgi:hypothetical protein